MELVEAPPVAVQRAGSLLAAAYTPPGARLVRADVEHGYHGTNCGLGYRLVDPCGAVDEATADRSYGSPSGGTFSGRPLVVEAQDTCSAMGTRDDRVARAQARLASVAGPAIGREFWTGLLATAAGYTMNPRLQAGGSVTDINSAGALGPLAALARMEQKLAEMLGGAPGVIHGTREAVTNMLQLGSLESSGDVILSEFGTRIVGDAGYPGTSAAGAAPSAGQSWLFGTARPTIILGDPVVVGELADHVDRASNTITVDAEQAFLILLECGILAVRVTLAT